MKYGLRTLLLSIAIIAILLGTIVPIVRWLTFDHVRYAETRLRARRAIVINLHDRVGVSCALVNLSGMRVTNEDLFHIKALNPSAEINLSRTSVDDDAIMQLAGVTAGRIVLTETQVTQSGLDAFRATLPHYTELVTDESHDESINKHD